jgi:hypothetical protein
LTMGRFATTVPLYEKLRPPYPAVFFSNVARRLPLEKEHARIDLGTGPGPLALGFAPYALIESKAEALPSDVGEFDVVTIGRAPHWIDVDAIAALFERIVAPDGGDPRVFVQLRR